MVTRGYKWLLEVTKGYKGLQGVTGGSNCHWELQGVTEVLKEVKRGYKGSQGVTKEFRGLQADTEG